MGDLTKNFSRYEFRCHCGCGGDTIDFQTLMLLQILRDDFNKAVRVESGFRCKEWNREVGGKKNSKHLTGRAIDFKVAGTQPYQVQGYLHLKYPGQLGIGSYSTFTHMDSRNKPARWSS